MLTMTLQAPTTTQAHNATKETVTTACITMTCNGAPSGAHYNLNIIGVSKDKTATMTTGDGHRIFVQLNGGEDAVSLNGKLASQLNKVNKIMLQPAPAVRASRSWTPTRRTATVHSSSFQPTSQRHGPCGLERSENRAASQTPRPARRPPASTGYSAPRTTSSSAPFRRSPWNGRRASRPS